MSVTVLVSASLRSFTDRIPEFSVDASTVQDALDALSDAYPDAVRGLFDESGAVREFINVYIGDRNIRSLKGTRSEVKDGDFILLIPAMAGGAQTGEELAGGAESGHEAAAQGSASADSPIPRIRPRERAARESIISKERFKEVSLGDKEIERYNKHLQLREISVKGQKRIIAAKVLIAGVGALGGVVAEQLAAAGVGTIGLADADLVELGNLQTQIIHGTRDVKRPKVSSAKDLLKKLNPLSQVNVHQVRLEADNISEILADYDIIVDATDNYKSRYLIADACALAGIPEVYGAMYQFEGTVSVFDPAHGAPCFRCMIPSPPPSGLVPTCSESGVITPLPGIIGSVMTTEVLKLLVGGGAPLLGRALVFDSWNLTGRVVEVPKDPGCAICGARPTIRSVEEIDYEDFCGMREDETEEPVEGIEAGELSARIASGERLTLIDVREPHERAIMRFPGAIVIPIGQLARRQKELDPSVDTIFICREGKRSILAIRTLREAGYTGPMYNLKGGVEAARQVIFPNEGAWL